MKAGETTKKPTHLEIKQEITTSIAEEEEEDDEEEED